MSCCNNAQGVCTKINKTIDLEMDGMMKCIGRCVGELVKFNPPVYEQRYSSIIHVISHKIFEGKIKKVVDFGCAELKLTRLLTRVPHLEHILCVDIDKELLEHSKSKIQPLSSDYLSKRPLPLTIDLYHGSIDAPDEVLRGVDAVIGIEIIEHLYPKTMVNVPFNVFGFIRPRVAIFTTPNVEFNVMFQLKTQFRHHDHKFEWTRSQFEDWAINICHRFPEYDVTFAGIGEAPEGHEHLGCVSQMAVFVRAEDASDGCTEDTSGTCTEDTNGGCTEEDVASFCAHRIIRKYKLIATASYPFFTDNRSDVEKLQDDMKYFVSMMKYNSEQEYFHFESNTYRLPLDVLWKRYGKKATKEEMVSAMSNDSMYKIEDDIVIVDASDEEY